MSTLDRLDPAAAGPYTKLVDGIWDGRLDLPLLERCRLRICTLLGAPPETARQATATAAAAATNTSPGPEDRDMACLAFTEQWVLDPHAMTDEHTAAVRAHLSPAECAAFTIALATIEAQVRTETTLERLR